MSIKKKILGAAVSLFAAVMAFTACGGAGKSDEGVTSETAAVTSVTAVQSTEVTEESAPADTEQTTEAPETQPAEAETAEKVTDNSEETEAAEYTEYRFRNNKYLTQHYQKHGIEMGFSSAEDYERAASDVINSPEALYKTEAEDGDGVYYIEATNEFVVLSTDGYIRTYFNPSGGKKYFDRQ